MLGTFSKMPILFALATLPTLTLVPEPAQSKPTAFAKPAGAPHVFGTIALPLKKTRFDDRWWRVLRGRAAAGQLTPLLRTARRLRNIEQLRLINASLNGRIRYRRDRHPSGDQWSTVGETLRQSAGDCEDYAIAKLQALKAVGVPERDLFMTIGHDGSASAVHAVLIARAGGQFFVLDNRMNDIVAHEEYRNFYPIITFGSGSSWLHGYERGKMPTAVKAMSIALQSGRALPVGSERGSLLVRAR